MKPGPALRPKAPVLPRAKPAVARPEDPSVQQEELRRRIATLESVGFRQVSRQQQSQITRMRTHVARLQQENSRLQRRNEGNSEVLGEPDAQLLIALQLSALDNDRVDPESLQLAMALHNSGIHYTAAEAGLRPSRFSRLSKAPYRAESALNEICPLCAQNFFPGESLIKLQCGHLYHPECAQGWFTDHSLCSVCEEEAG